MKLFIAEKPSLAKAIADSLGIKNKNIQNGCYEQNDTKITWCVGHMLELYDPEDYDIKYKKWDMQDLPIKSHYPPHLKQKENLKSQLAKIKKLLLEADEVIHCGDPDDEGQLLVDEILKEFNYKNPVFRALISDLNPNSVLKEIEKAKTQNNKNYQKLSDAALARSISDQIFGYNLTRCATLKAQEIGYSGVINVGRVQSTVIGLINKRTLDIENHKESLYFDAVAKCNEVDFKYIPDPNIIDPDLNLVTNKELLEPLKYLINKNGTVTQKDIKTTTINAPLVYNLSTLQQQASKLFGFSASKTLEIAQKLYEEYKVLTYPRSDCRYLSEEDLAHAPEIINQLKNDLGLNLNFNLNIKHNCFNSSKITAHHGLRPTGIKMPALDENCLAIYKLVSYSFLALFLEPSIKEITSYEIDIESKLFKASETFIIQEGYEALLKGNKENNNKTSKINLEKGDMVLCSDIEIKESKTKPPKYFTESSLLKAMTNAASYIEDPTLKKALIDKDKANAANNGSIGTEATRAYILEKIANNKILIEYKKEKGYKEKIYKTTKAGIGYCNSLPQEIIKPDISASWSIMQEKIKDGEINISNFLETVDSYIEIQINLIKKSGLNMESKFKKCPKCENGVLKPKIGKYGKFFGCSNYKNGCKAIFKELNGEPVIK
ncbi:MAG: DNA topoisomerase [Psittacicella sp.]